MDAFFGRNSVPLAPEIEANRRQFMDEYREIQARIAMMGHDTDRHTPTTLGGHTSETAIEITEEEDGMDEDDVVLLT